MISRHVKKFCCEHLSLIENYEKAINDNTQSWECHHRQETDKELSREQLKELGLYYNRPASELIFLTKSEHRRIHFKGDKNPSKNMSEETKIKISESCKGRTAWNKGSQLSYEHKQHLSDSHKGRQFSEEHKQHLSDSQKGRQLSEEQRKRISDGKKRKDSFRRT